MRLRDFDPKAPGGCVGKPVDLPLVQIAATAESQTKNTMRQVVAMTSKKSRVVQEYGLDPGQTRIMAPAGGELQVITSSAAAAEGAEVTFAIGDETEHWRPNNGGPLLMEVIERNLAKSGSRMVETLNAWEPGADSVAEATWDAWEAQQQGRTRGEGAILYDARIPTNVDLTDELSLTAGLEFAYGDTAQEQGGWVDLRTTRNKVWSPKTKADVARRYWLNQPTATTDAWVARHQWESLHDSGRVLEDGEAVALFFDGSLSRDATALMGCAMSDGHVFTLGVWEPDPNDDDSRVDTPNVDLTVDRAFERFEVLGFFADVREFESFAKVSWPQRYADRLIAWALPAAKEPQSIAWDMRSHGKEFTLAVELCEREILDGEFTHDGDPRIARHIANARRLSTPHGIAIRKESPDSARKIDGAVCVVGARMVRRQVLASKAYAKRLRRGNGRMVVHRF